VSVADESAKLPIGALLAALDANRVLDASENLLPAGFRFRPIDQLDTERGFNDLTQLVQGTATSNESPLEVAHAAGTRLTLWGPDKLGLKRASPETLDSLWRALFQRPAPTQLHELRESAGDEVDVLSQLALRETELSLARQWMSSRTSHYSVWIIPQPPSLSPAAFCIQWGSKSSLNHRRIEY
jgi:hypothetical protein